MAGVVKNKTNTKKLTKQNTGHSGSKRWRSILKVKGVAEETMEDMELRLTVITDRSFQTSKRPKKAVLRVSNSLCSSAEEFACELSLTD